MKTFLRLFVFSLLAMVAVACGSNGDEANETAPEFTLPSANTAPVSLSDYAGRPVLLYFHMAVG